MATKPKDETEAPEDEAPPDDEDSTDDDGDGDESAIEEVDLDELVDARVEAALVKLTNITNAPPASDTSETPPPPSSEGAGDASRAASPPSDVEAAVQKALDERELRQQVQALRERIENPPAPEPKKRSGIARLWWG